MSLGDKATASIRVLIVDDHPVVRSGIRGMLAGQPDITVSAEAANGLDALEHIREQLPEVVLMDLRMPKMDGLTAIRQLKQQEQTQQGYTTAVLVLTTYDDDQDIALAVQAGACGYLLKDVARERLHDAIRAAARGETVLEAQQLQRIMAQRHQPERDTLSRRELQVLRLVARGSSNKAIGTTLRIGEATVKTHLLNIYSKLDVSERTSAVITALRLGLIGLEDTQD